MHRLLGIALAIVLLIALLGWYVTRRAQTAFGLTDRVRRALHGALIVLAALPFALRFSEVELHDGAAQVIGGSAWAVSFVTLGSALALVVFDVLRAVGRRLRRSSAAPVVTATEATDVTSDAPPEVVDDAPLRPDPVALGRRDFLARAVVTGAVGASASATAYGMIFGRHDYVVEQVPIVLSRLPRQLDGYTIAQLSDIHVGTYVGERELAAAVELVRSARPDLIVLTGDLLDHDPRQAAHLGRLVRRLAELGARDGVTAILGNHDYYAGAEVVLDVLRRSGATTLVNEARAIGNGAGRFALLGVDDVWARQYPGRGADLDATFASMPEANDLARVLLCHNPELFPEVAPRVDLQLSGHTHGGQVKLVVRPADLVLRHGLIAGRYVRGESQVYVNRGFGTAGPPIRLGSPPEVSRIILASR